MKINILNRFFLDGWFPVFPWLGLIIFGALFAEKRMFFLSVKKYITIFGLSLFSIGAILIINEPFIQVERSNYLELFYPSTINFIIMSLGMCIGVGINILSYKIQVNQFNKVLSEIGSKSLFVYILHCAIIHFFIIGNFSELSFIKLILLDSIFIIICFLIVIFIKKKSDSKFMRLIPNLFKKIVGL